MAFRELKKVVISDQNRIRRWFSSDKLQLIVWLTPEGTIMEFQLLYQAGWEDKAINWHYQEGFSHHNVDDGEGKPGRPKMSPILMADGYFNKVDLARSLREEGESLEPAIREFIQEKISTYQFSREITVGEKLQVILFTTPELKLTLGKVSVISLRTSGEVTAFIQQHYQQLCEQEIEFLGAFCWLILQERAFSKVEKDLRKELSCLTGIEPVVEVPIERGMRAIHDYLASVSGKRDLRELGTDFLEKKLEEVIVPKA